MIATLLTYVYVVTACPSCEGKLEKGSPAFFAQEIEEADDALEAAPIQTDRTDNVISFQEEEIL